MLISPNYNERSWAIDLIGHLKHLSSINNRSIKDAGGEQTIQTDGGSLFPDVLLFGDRSTARILQGWELKMPDTNINDRIFKENAEIKARALGLDSFLLWNVSSAILYVKNSTSNSFEIRNQWNNLSDIRNRREVIENSDRWKDLATEIFYYLNDLFDRGALEGRPFIEAYQSGGITSLIMENSPEVSESLAKAKMTDISLRSRITVWWDRYQAEYGEEDPIVVLGKVNISNWIGKIIFAQILRENDMRAHDVSNIGDETTPLEALNIFREISENCNFWTIFSSEGIGLELIPENTWRQLKQFNYLLSDLRIGSVDQSQLSGILEATVKISTRKLRGQYPTPIQLAKLLVRLCIQDNINDRVLDPCCGSGTIARAALEQKINANVDAEVISQTIYAGDQDPQAVQIATFALARPQLMHMPLKVFQQDAFALTPSLEIDFRDPSNGEVFTERIGEFQAIVSNLPFVSQNGRVQYGNAIRDVTQVIGEQFSGRADISAYLPFSFHPLLTNGGRLGIIITNAWLGTKWGDDFYTNIERFYKLKCVITSGAGRWFQNSSVITNLLVLEKQDEITSAETEINFIVLTRPLEELEDEESIQITAAQIELGQTHTETMTIRAVSRENLNQFRELGLGGNAQFVNCDWILDLPLQKLSTVFRITRGERRGNNALFYPRGDHGIEPEYIKPLVKSPTDFTRLSCSASKEAFSCSLTEDELRALGHEGALNWINHFSTDDNVEKLSQANLMWYEMRADTVTDLVMFINYGDRLFFGRVDPPAFVDQRLIRLDPIIDVDIELYHALFNSTISMFIIEGMGFGRGLGALDLSKDRIENFMHVLDPTILNTSQVSRIKELFIPIKNRDIMAVADELEQLDRKIFDDFIIECFDLEVSRQQIYDALLSLVEIRLTSNT